MKYILFLLIPIMLMAQARTYLPVPVVSSSGRGFNNETVVIYPTGTTTGGKTLTYLSGSNGAYYWTGGSDSVSAGAYDIYVNGILWRSNISLNEDVLSADVRNKVLGNAESTGLDSVGVYEHISSMKVYNALDYGIDNTGSNDISTDFWTLVNTTISDSSILYFPRGTYKFSASAQDTFEKVLYLKGQGIGQTIFDFNNSSDVFVIGNNLLVEDIEFKNANDLFEDRPGAWTGKNLDYFILRNCRFYNIKRPLMSVGYDSTYFIKSIDISNNYIDSCYTGFKSTAHCKTRSFINNHFSRIWNMSSGGDTISYAIYAGSPTDTSIDGSTVIIGNTIDSLYAYSGDVEHNGIIAYGSQIAINGNVLSRFGIGSGTQRGISGMYLAGSNISVNGNVFYNVSKTNVANKAQDIWTKGAAATDEKYSHLITNNIFYTDRDSAGYHIYMQSPAHISGNEIRSLGNGELAPYCFRLGTSTDYFDKTYQNTTIVANKIYSNRNFSSTVAANSYSFKSNEAHLDTNKTFITNIASSNTIINIMSISDNEVTGGIFLVSPEKILQIDINNNTVTSDTTIIDLDKPYNMNVNGNTFIVDTLATPNGNIIAYYNSTAPDNNAVVNWSNNTHIFRGTFSSNLSYIFFRGGYWSINNNYFIMDSVSSVSSYARAINANGNNSSLYLNNNKFITLGTEKWEYAIITGSGTYPIIKITNNFFDDYMTYAIRNFGTITDLILYGNYFNSTNKYGENGTKTNFYSYFNQGLNTVAGDSLMFIWGTDTLYLYKTQN